MTRWTLPAIRVLVLPALLGVVACTGTDPACGCADPNPSAAVPAGDGVGESAGPYAVMHGGDEVHLVDTDSQVVDSLTLPEHAVIRQPVPGTVSFLGTDTVWNLDLATGDVAAVDGLPDSGSRLQDGQRLVVDSHAQSVTDAAESQETASDEPGPEIFDGVFDVLTGEQRSADDLLPGEAVVLDRVGDTVVLEVEGADGLVLLRVDRGIGDPVELAVDDLADVHFSSDGHIAAVEADGGVRLGDTSRALRRVADSSADLLGVVGEDVLVVAGGQLVRVDGRGGHTALAPAGRQARLEHSSGLVSLGTDEAPRWFRVTDRALEPVHQVRGMTLSSADDSGWWFSTGEQVAPLRRTPLIAVDPQDGRVSAVRGTLSQLAGLAQATPTNHGRFREAEFVNGNGSEDLALADAHTGQVVTLDVTEQPLTIAEEGEFIASTTVQGPTITTVSGGSTRVVPVFDIDSDHEQWDYHWVVGG